MFARVSSFPGALAFVPTICLRVSRVFFVDDRPDAHLNCDLRLCDAYDRDTTILR